MEHFSYLSFGLVLVINRASEYEVDSRRGFRWVFSTCNCPVDKGGCFYAVGRLANVSFEVPSPNQFFYQEL